MTYRIATHRCAPASAVEVERGMCTHDVIDAHEILDMIDAQIKKQEGN